MFYRTLSRVLPVLMVAVAVAGRSRWPATAAALIYTAVIAGTSWVLMLFPATPKLGPIYQDITHYVPLDFPLLLVVPAFALDLTWRRVRDRPWWIASPALGAAFLVSFLAVQWPFADFLMRFGRNWFFHIDNFVYWRTAGIGAVRLSLPSAATGRSFARRAPRVGAAVRDARQRRRPRVGSLDDARAALMSVRRLAGALRASLALVMAVMLAAHVGSPDVFRSGRAGPYAVDVVVRPPQVVPGIAEILVRVADPRVSRVTVRPVYWRAGTKGAPSADDAKPVRGSAGAYSGRLWLMAGGSYSVHVTVVGSAGQGTLIVPVAAVATGQLQLSSRPRGGC